jgi:hypothetical protein
MKEQLLCRFLGYLFSDASLRIKKVKNKKKIQTEVMIECADKSIVQDFSNICHKLLEREVGKIHTRKRSENWRRTYIFYCKINKKWRNQLFSFSPTYRTKPVAGEYPKIRISDIVFSKRANVISFLQAFVNGEGSIQLRVTKHDKWFELTRYIKISCSHPYLLNQVSKMLEILNIHHRVAPLKNPKAIIIQKKKSVIDFKETIGFMDGICVSNNGRWASYEKKQILRALVNSFDIPRGRLQEFADKESVYKFLNVNYLPEMDSETRIQILRGAAGAKISQKPFLQEASAFRKKALPKNM